MNFGPPRIDIGYYPDGRRVQLLDLGVGKVAEIPIADGSEMSLPHTPWKRQGDNWVYSAQKAES